MSDGHFRVMIVEDEALVGIGLQEMFAALGHEVVGQAADPAQTRGMFTATQPEVVVVDIRLNSPEGTGDGIDLARSLLAIRRVPMMVISAFSDAELVARAGEAGVFGYLVKPVEQSQLGAQLEIAVKRFREHEAVRLENEQLAQNLETRKLTEKAKGILMRRLHLDESDAHKRLQQESQKRRISLADLAKKIIESEELLGGG